MVNISAKVIFYSVTRQVCAQGWTAVFLYYTNENSIQQKVQGH